MLTSIGRGAVGFAVVWVCITLLNQAFPLVLAGFLRLVLVLVIALVGINLWAIGHVTTPGSGAQRCSTAMLLPALVLGGMTFLFTRELIRPSSTALLATSLLAAGFVVALGAGIGAIRGCASQLEKRLYIRQIRKLDLPDMDAFSAICSVRVTLRPHRTDRKP